MPEYGKIEFLSCTEESVLNPEYKGWRIARIEVYLSEEPYPIQVGQLRVYKNDELFSEIVDLIESKKS